MSLRSSVLFFVAVVCLSSGCLPGPAEPPSGELDCSNGQDEDEDGFIDCEDSDCQQSPQCSEAGACGDGLDNDEDGLLDCADSDCSSDPACQEAGNCTDEVDNDLDGAMDCEDEDCLDDSSCQEAGNCADGTDNDLNGLTDCGDPACQEEPSCEEASACDDDVDNDGNGLIDCDDEACVGNVNCSEDRFCGDERDNDGDGLVDCGDPDCFGSAGCETELHCGDGADNDLDERTDCRDADCHDQEPCASLPPFEAMWLGDTLLGDAAQSSLDSFGYIWPFLNLEGSLEADWIVINAEAPITTIDEPWDPEQTWSYNSQPEAAAAFADMGIDACGLSNNHAMDRGGEGISDTILHLEANGIDWFGAGLDEEQAREPLMLETPWATWGVIGLGRSWGSARTATADQPGTLAFSVEEIEASRDLAWARGADFVAAFVHWGRNYTNVQSSQRDWAAAFALAGYDMVIGHGPHREQEIELVDGMPVAWSVGNFIFGTPGRFTSEFPGYALMLTTDLGPAGVEAFRIRCIRTDNDDVSFQPEPCAPDEASIVLEALHPDLVMDGDLGVWSLGG